jgi:hypothetical protein
MGSTCERDCAIRLFQLTESCFSFYSHKASTVDVRMSMEYRWNDPEVGNTKYGDGTFPSVTSLTTNPTWNNLRLNPAFRSERAQTNRLIHDTAN